jgi:hypothetical protein
VAAYRTAAGFVGTEKIREYPDAAAAESALQQATDALQQQVCAAFMAGSAPNIVPSVTPLASGGTGPVSPTLVRIDSRILDGSPDEVEWVAVGRSGRSVWTVHLGGQLPQEVGDAEIARLAGLAARQVAATG